MYIRNSCTINTCVPITQCGRKNFTFTFEVPSVSLLSSRSQQCPPSLASPYSFISYVCVLNNTFFELYVNGIVLQVFFCDFFLSASTWDSPALMPVAVVESFLLMGKLHCMSILQFIYRFHCRLTFGWFLLLQTILFINNLHVQELTRGRGLQTFLTMNHIYNKREHFISQPSTHTCKHCVHMNIQHMEAKFSCKNTYMQVHSDTFFLI